MIVNELLVVDYISNWLADYAKNNDINRFVIVKEFGYQEILEYICKEASKKYSGLKIINCDNYISAHNSAIENNRIIIGAIDRTFGLYNRSYSKRKEALADIFPLFDLEKSEIIQISKKLLPELDYDVWPSYKLLEFCNTTEGLYGIITNEKPPHQHERWPYFTQDQKQWIGIVHQREKKTRHKILTRPYPIISDKPSLCIRNAP